MVDEMNADENKAKIDALRVPCEDCGRVRFSVQAMMQCSHPSGLHSWTNPRAIVPVSGQAVTGEQPSGLNHLQEREICTHRIDSGDPDRVCTECHEVVDDNWTPGRSRQPERRG